MSKGQCSRAICRAIGRAVRQREAPSSEQSVSLLAAPSSACTGAFPSSTSTSRGSQPAARRVGERATCASPPGARRTELRGKGTERLERAISSTRRFLLTPQGPLCEWVNCLAHSASYNTSTSPTPRTLLLPRVLALLAHISACCRVMFSLALSSKPKREAMFICERAKREKGEVSPAHRDG